APTRGNAATPISPSAPATASRPAGCSTARPARHASPNARGRPCSAAAFPTTRPGPSSPTWPTAAASARPAAWSRSARTRSSATPCGPAATPANSTTSWWAFPPWTKRVQLDEKWANVFKKSKHCDPDDEADWFKGAQWDHVALAPDSRLVLEVAVGPRTADCTAQLLEGVRDRLGGRVPELITSDEFAAYPEAVLSAFGKEQVPPRTGRPGRPAGPRVVPPEGMCYATVHKTRERGRGTAVSTRVGFGTLGEGERGSTAYLERHKATAR